MYIHFIFLFLLQSCHFPVPVCLAGMRVASTPQGLINADAFWFTVCHVGMSLYA